MDRLLSISLSLYDMILAIYLIIISTTSFVTRKQFCKKDIQWRSSIWCNVAGFLYQVATFGSLQIAVAMAITRCHIICSKLGFLLKIKIAKTGIMVIHFVNVLLGVIPLLPIYWPRTQHFFDMFIFNCVFQNNPIVTLANKSELVSILVSYQNITNEIRISNLQTTPSSIILSQLKILLQIRSYLATTILVTMDIMGPLHFASLECTLRN